MSKLQIRPICLPCVSLEPLRKEAVAQGFRFLERLVADWDSGCNRFDQEGEGLLGGFAGKDLLGVGGLNRDPYLDAGNIGRLRHLYVLNTYRRRGIGSEIVDHLLQNACGVFGEVRLRTDSEQAAHFYSRRGFRAIGDPTASHTGQL